MEQQAQTNKTPAWKSPWLIGWMGLVLTVLAVNLVMVYLAIETNPGLVVEDYYDRGQDYEKTMFSKRANDPGWHMKVDLPEVLVAGEHIPVHFSVVDKSGVPVVADSAIFYAYRPSDVTRDFSQAMQQEATGLYSTKAQFRLKGVWDIMLAVTQGGEEYSIGRRINLVAPD